MRHRTYWSEDGSFVMVLLAALVVGGVLAALFMTVDTGVQSARQDRDFAQAFQVADAGVQDGYSTLMGLDPDDPDDAPPCGVIVEAATAAPCSRELGDGSVVEWTYQRVGGFGWTIDAHGTHLGSTRRIVADFRAPSLFEADITAVDLVDIRGAMNGMVTVASFCDFNFAGNPPHDYVEGVSGIQRIIQYGPPNPLCSVASTHPSSLERLQPYPREAGPDITDRAAAVCATPADDVTVIERLPENVVRGTTYCVEETRNRHQLAGTSTEPAKVYIYNTSYSGDVINVTGSGGINTGASAQAGDLQIYISNGGGDVKLRGSTEMVATVYAPYSTCDRGGSGSFRGAWFCGTVISRGNFSPDSTASQIRDGDLSLDRYSEESPNL